MAKTDDEHTIVFEGEIQVLWAFWSVANWAHVSLDALSLSLLCFYEGVWSWTDAGEHLSLIWLIRVSWASLLFVCPVDVVDWDCSVRCPLHTTKEKHMTCLQLNTNDSLDETNSTTK